MKVDYIEHMGTDRSVLNAARASFNKSQPDDAPISERDKSLLLFLARGYQEAEWDNIAQTLAALGDPNIIKEIMWDLRNKPAHFIPFAHPQISVRITAPLAIARQLWKAHIGAVGGDVGYAAWSECSLRYLADEPVFWLPEKWRKKALNVKQGSSDEVAEIEVEPIKDLMQCLGQTYVKLIQRIGIAPELARLVLPAATETTWVWTGSLAFFARVCHQRIDPHAQREAGYVAGEISTIIEPLFPYSWSALRFGKMVGEA
jgi:thymidylate synthase (FAD)